MSHIISQRTHELAILWDCQLARVCEIVLRRANAHTSTMRTYVWHASGIARHYQVHTRRGILHMTGWP